MGVYLDYNQAELDDAYDQTKWAGNISKRSKATLHKARGAASSLVPLIAFHTDRSMSNASPYFVQP